MLICIYDINFCVIVGSKLEHEIHNWATNALLLSAAASKPFKTKIQANSIYYTELRVSTYLGSSPGLQLVFKTYWGKNIYYVSLQKLS
jgi:hypothetical protein